MATYGLGKIRDQVERENPENPETRNSIAWHFSPLGQLCKLLIALMYVACCPIRYIMLHTYRSLNLTGGRGAFCLGILKLTPLFWTILFYHAQYNNYTMSENEIATTDYEAMNVLAMVPPKVRESILRAFEAHPEYQSMGEDELREVIHPSIKADRMRLAFWEEYYRAQDKGTNMVMAKVYGANVSLQNFYAYFLKNDEHVIWMLTPPADFHEALKADLLAGKDELGKILRIKLFNDDGSVKIKEAYLFLKVFDMYANRVYGAAIQRVEQKTQTIPYEDVSGDPEKIREVIAQARLERAASDEE